MKLGGGHHAQLGSRPAIVFVEELVGEVVGAANYEVRVEGSEFSQIYVSAAQSAPAAECAHGGLTPASYATYVFGVSSRILKRPDGSRNATCVSARMCECIARGPYSCLLLRGGHGLPHVSGDNISVLDPSEGRWQYLGAAAGVVNLLQGCSASSPQARAPLPH
jgi:hypothetical protein